jgi:hypothetical protein
VEGGVVASVVRIRVVGALAVRTWWAEALAIALLSRLFTLALIGIAATRAERLSPGHFWWSANPFTIWDGNWYLQIAATGYHFAPDAIYQDFAFFPLWPLTIRLATLNGLLPAEIVAPILSNLLFIAALVVVYRAFLGFAEPGIARVSLWLVALGPGAYIFSWAYSESLFLLLSAASFCTWGARRVGFVVLAQLTRLTGLALALGGLVEAVRSGRRREGVAVFVAGTLTYAAWWAYIAWLTGDPLGYVRGTPSWTEGTVGPMSVLEAPVALGLFAIGYTLLMLVGSVRVLRDRHLTAGTFSIFAVMTAIMLGAWSEMPRYAMVGFPANVGLTLLMPTPRSRLLLVVFFASMQAAWVVAVYSEFGMP